jgi:uncharacterized protein YndB with AHSA1/START domain
METIRHRVGIRAPREKVLSKLTTIDGLSSWWTRDTVGDPTAGGKVEFFFGSPERCAAMEVAEVTDSRVVWHCVGGPDEWVGGELTFDARQEGDETVMKFTHTWREPVDFMFHCSTKWAYFLLSLKAALESDEGTPFPRDLKISSWG